MKKSTLAILILSGLLFAACDDTDVPEPQTTNCGAMGTFKGVLGDNIFTASMDDNATHKSGYCLADEICVNLYESSGNGPDVEMFACSAAKAGHLMCNNELTEVINNINNCGKCGKQCNENEECKYGVCRVISRTCNEGAVQCSNNGKGNAIEKCSGNAWNTVDSCDYKCSEGECIEKVCDEGAVQCKEGSETVPQKCEGNTWVDQAACGFKCSNGSCIEKVCDEGSSRCDGSKQIVCNDNKEETTECKDGCNDDKCNDHICDSGYYRCTDDGLGIQQCKNNTWTAGSTCGKNEVCGSDYTCVCAPNMEKCGDSCVDLQTDPNNCGSCGNKVASCAGGKACVANNKFVGPYSSVSSCCDPNAKKYAYLDHALNCNEGSKFVKFRDSDGTSLSYCLTDADVKAVANYSKCLVNEENYKYLSDKNKCGISSASYEACTLVATTNESKYSTVCDAGRCCFESDDDKAIYGAGPGGSTSFNETHTFNKNDCCSKIAFQKSSAGGIWSYCTDNADYYKEACASCPSGNKCEVDEAKKSCSIRNSGTGTSITML